MLQITSGAPAFKGRIIDTHVHSGHWFKDGAPGFNYDKNFTDMLKTPFNAPLEEDKFEKTAQEEGDRVEKIVISGLDAMSDVYSGEFADNEALLNLVGDDSFYVPLIVCRPDKTDGNPAEIERLLEKYPDSFSGFKFHPSAMGLNADDQKYEPYMELAQKQGYPCVFHSEGSGVSDVELIYNLAKKFPDVPVIMAHMGAGGASCHDRAINVFEQSLKNNDANIYVDLSWVDWGNGLPSSEKPSVKKVLDVALKYNALDKILFATDTPLGCFGERLEGGLSAHDAYGLSIETLKNFIKKNYPENYSEISEKIFFENAEKLFNI